VIFADFYYVYDRLDYFIPPNPKWANSSYLIPDRITQLVDGFDIPQLAEGKSETGCSDTPLCGYDGNTCHIGTVRGEPDKIVDGFYNQNDIFKLFSEEAGDGRYKKWGWPRWPLDRKVELEQFLSFKQVGPVPEVVRRSWLVSQITFLIFLIFAGHATWTAWLKRRAKDA
jgi:hypothetical protein